MRSCMRRKCKGEQSFAKVRYTELPYKNHHSTEIFSGTNEEDTQAGCGNKANSIPRIDEDNAYRSCNSLHSKYKPCSKDTEHSCWHEMPLQISQSSYLRFATTSTHPFLRWFAILDGHIPINTSCHHCAHQASPDFSQFTLNAENGEQ